MFDEDLSRGERENLHKWGKARRIIDEEKIELDVSSDDRYQFIVTGDEGVYTVGVDIDSGETFCPCPFTGDSCAHQISAHIYLTRIGVENEHY